MHYHKNKKRGFTVVELLIVILISVVLMKIVVTGFGSLSNSSSLNKDASIVLSFVEKARAKSINSVNGTEHGVHFTSTSVQVFSGAAYSSGVVEDTYTLSSKSTISAINLPSSATSLYFAKLTGNASISGNVVSGNVVVSPATGGAGKTIMIYATGVSEIQ